MSLVIAYRGNFQPDLPSGVQPWSTESHIAQSLEALGHSVWTIQEDRLDWPETIELAEAADLFLWTCTYGFAHQWDQEVAHEAIRHLNKKVPTAAFHLDRFLGLDREDQLATEPWFRVKNVFTADGSNRAAWKKYKINHKWLPPGVFHGEAIDGTPQAKYTSELAFVGSWQGYGHAEWWPQRKAMLDNVRQWYGNKFRCYPRGPAIRGMELTNLYSSVKIAVGDSCLSGGPSFYWSDRIPETLGRGALLVHPDVEGLDKIHPHLPTYPMGDWDALRRLLRALLADEPARLELRRLNIGHTRANHTYKNRMEEMLRLIGLTE